MSTRTFTLEEIRAAFKEGVSLQDGTWFHFEHALLDAKPEAPAEPCPECARNLVTRETCPFHKPNPAPAASPPAWLPLGQHPGGECDKGCGERLRMFAAFGQEGADRYSWCTPYCRKRAAGKTPVELSVEADRAKAEPRDAGQPGVPVWRGYFRTRNLDGSTGWRGYLPSGVDWDKMDFSEQTSADGEVVTVTAWSKRASEAPAAAGGQPGVPECRQCAAPAVAKSTQGWDAGNVYCEAHRLNGDVSIVPAEPIRPVTEDAVPQRCPACESAYDPDGHAPCLACGGTRIAPPAPGNHPGTPESCKACGMNPCHGMCARQDFPAGRPDEAPLSPSGERYFQALAIEATAEFEKRTDEFAVEIATRDARIAELEAQINTPEVLDFARAVQMEAAHQRLRWGTDHDAGKTDSDWYWLLAHIAGKALHGVGGGDNSPEKQLHRIATIAAVAANWHLYRLGIAGGSPAPAGANESVGKLTP